MGMISLRLSPDLERKLDSLAKSKGKSRSEIVKESILEYMENHSSEKSCFQLGEDLFGKHSSENIGLSKNRKKILADLLKGKDDKRRSH